MKGLSGHGAPVTRSSISVLPPSEVLSCGLVPVAASPGADQQRAVVEDQQPAAAVATAGRGEAGDEDALVRRPRRRGVHPPHQDPDVGRALRVAAGAGVEAPVVGEVGVDRQPHQAGLARGPDQVGGHLQAAYVAVLDDRQPAGALGDEAAALADRVHVPGVVEPGGDPGDPQPRGGLCSAPVSSVGAGCRRRLVRRESTRLARGGRRAVRDWLSGSASDAEEHAAPGIITRASTAASRRVMGSPYADGTEAPGDPWGAMAFPSLPLWPTFAGARRSGRCFCPVPACCRADTPTGGGTL